MKRYTRTVQSKVSDEIFQGFDQVAKEYRSTRSRIIREALEAWILSHQTKVTEEHYFSEAPTAIALAEDDT